MRQRPKTTKSKREETPRRGEIPSGRTIGQAVSDARSRETQTQVERLESKLVALLAERVEPVGCESKPPMPERKLRHRRPDQRQVSIANKKALGWSGTEICRFLDASHRRDLAPLKQWVDATGLRLWIELWNAAKFGFPKIQACVRKYIRLVLPFTPHKRS